MLELEFYQFQDDMKLKIRVSFLNSSLFYPSPSQIKKWDKVYLKYRKPSHDVVFWEKEHLQSLYYYATKGLKYNIEFMKPVPLANASSLAACILDRKYKVETQMHWKRKDTGQTYLKWKFMVGKTLEWGSVHIHVDYPEFPESSDTSVQLDEIPEFDKRKAYLFLKEHPKMMKRYEQVVPIRMNATKFFELYYKDLFNVAFFRRDVFSVHRQAAMLRANPVLQKAYKKYVVNGTITHSDFFRFAISRNRVDEGVDEQQLGDLKMDQLFEELKEEQKKHYQTSIGFRLINADTAFDLRLMEGERRKDGYGIQDNNLPYDIDIENPEKKLYQSGSNILRQINRRSDRLLNPSQCDL